MDRISRETSELVWMPGPFLALHDFGDSVEILDPTSFKTSRRIGEGKRVLYFAAALDGNTVAFCENGNTVEIHNLRSEKVLSVDAKNNQPSMTFSPDGKQLATGGYGRQARLWSTTSGELIRAFDAPVLGGLKTIFSPDGKLFVVGNRNDVTRVFELETGKLVRTIPKKMSHEIKFSPNGKMLAISYVDGSVALWDVAEGKLLVEQKTVAKEIYTLDWSPAGDILVTAGLEGKITFWETVKLTVIKELPAPDWVISVRFSPDGSRLFTAGGTVDSSNRKITVWGLDAP